MSPSWVLRWNTRDEPRPRVLAAAGSPAPGPSVWSDASGSFALCHGDLFDRSELGDPGASAAALVAGAYERWRDALFDKLRGACTVAVWDEERRRLLVGRDAMGLSPCYYCWDGRLFLMAASLDALLDQPGVDDRVNRVVIAEYIQDWLSDDQAQETFYRSIRRLPPAHALTLGQATLGRSRYWDPVPPGFAWASEAELARFPSVLARAVERCLAAGADSVLLSGGFDSISIAAVAAGERGEAPLHAVSLRFSGTPCDEGDTQAQVARTLGMPLLMRTTDECLDGQGPVAAVLALSGTSPSPVLSPWQAMHTGLVRSAAGLGLRRLLSGSGGDDMFNVDLAHAADCLATLDLGGLWRFYRAFQRTSQWSAIRVAKHVLWDRAAKRELRRLAGVALERVRPDALARLRRRRHERLRPSWLAPADPDLRALLEHRHLSPAEVPLAPGERDYVRALRRLPQAPFFLLEQDHVSAWADALGVRLLHPYFDRDLVELSMRMHPEHVIAGGRFKTPLRRLLAERLPSVAMRQKKVDFTEVFRRVFRAEGAAVWESLGGARSLDELGLVDSRRLGRIVGEYLAGSDRQAVQLWQVLSTEAWLQARSGRRPARAGLEEALT